MNPDSGRGPADRSELAAAFPDGEIVECDPSDIGACVEKAVRNGASYVAVAGGDGTVRGAVGAVVDAGVPLVPVPTGTRNHFARQLGIDTVDDAGRARSREPSCVDVAEVNGAWFVNNSSIGIYPKVVVRREAHERRLPKSLAQVVAVWEQVRHGHRFRAALDGEWHRAWMVFVGNGRYERGLFGLTQRESLEDHVLDVRLVRADATLARVRVVLALLVGRLHRSPLLVQRLVKEVRVDLDRPRVEVALDGEVEELATPLVYRSHAGALAVLRTGQDDAVERGRKIASR